MMAAIGIASNTIAWCLLLWIWLGSAIAMTGMWAYARSTNNIGYVDVAWAALMGVMAIAVAVGSHGGGVVRCLIGAMVALWALRLALHLFARVHKHPEDGRYAYLRKHWDGHQDRLFLFFQAQAVIVALFALPLLVAASNPIDTITLWTIAAISVWIVAVAGESIADRQLAAWVGNPANRGKTCRRGLWAWSRHPNYFFEWLHWFAYALLAIGAPMAWLALSGPVLMFAFLYRVTGIPYTEAQSLRSRGDDYRSYQRDVSAFFPWPPRHRI
jgi:steroid 5-alpha reductase family enzyme